MKTLVLGGSGLLGSAIVRKLQRDNVEVISFSSKDCDLVNPEKDELIKIFKKIKPEAIYHCAGFVGGIGANLANPYEFLFHNAKMAVNVIDAAVSCNIYRLFYMSSSCVYPAHCDQPMKEDHILTGIVEDTNRGYAVAKLLGMEATREARKKTGGNYISMIPCNLYGSNDDFSERGHVISSIIHKIKEAKAKKKNSITIWGDGTPRREFLHVDDAAEIIIFAAQNISADYINIGSGKDISIYELAQKILKLDNSENISIDFDFSKPNGMMKKCLDISKIAKFGWKPKISLDQGIEDILKCLAI